MQHSGTARHIAAAAAAVLLWSPRHSHLANFRPGSSLHREAARALLTLLVPKPAAHACDSPLTRAAASAARPERSPFRCRRCCGGGGLSGPAAAWQHDTIGGVLARPGSARQTSPRATRRSLPRLSMTSTKQRGLTQGLAPGGGDKPTLTRKHNIGQLCKHRRSEVGLSRTAWLDPGGAPPGRRSLQLKISVGRWSAPTSSNEGHTGASPSSTVCVTPPTSPTHRPPLALFCRLWETAGPGRPVHMYPLQCTEDLICRMQSKTAAAVAEAVVAAAAVTAEGRASGNGTHGGGDQSWQQPRLGAGQNPCGSRGRQRGAAGGSGAGSSRGGGPHPPAENARRSPLTLADFPVCRHRGPRSPGGGRGISSLKPPSGSLVHSFKNRAMKPVIACLLLLAFCAVRGQALYSDGGVVALLDSSNFDSTISTSTGLFLVEWFAPW